MLAALFRRSRGRLAMWGRGRWPVAPQPEAGHALKGLEGPWLLPPQLGPILLPRHAYRYNCHFCRELEQAW